MPNILGDMLILRIFFPITLIFSLTTPQEISIYSRAGFQGNHSTHNISNCIPTLSDFPVRSIHTYNNCVQLYANEGCSGGDYLIIRPGSPSHQDLSYYRFDGKTLSLGPCYDHCHSDNVEQSNTPTTLSFYPIPQSGGQGAGVSVSAPIPGTNLYPSTWYRIGMKKFLGRGWLSWTTATISGDYNSNFVKIDIGPRQGNYEEGGKWWADVQWRFIPSEVEGFYTLHLKAAGPQAIVGVKHENSTNYKHLILARDSHLISSYSVNGSNRDDALFQLVPTGLNQLEYQLRVRSTPEGVVTWTELKYREHSHYIQLSTNAEHTDHYKREGKWWEDTLFYFNPVPNRTKDGGGGGDGGNDAVFLASVGPNSCSDISVPLLENFELGKFRVKVPTNVCVELHEFGDCTGRSTQLTVGRKEGVDGSITYWPEGSLNSVSFCGYNCNLKEIVEEVAAPGPNVITLFGLEDFYGAREDFEVSSCLTLPEGWGNGNAKSIITYGKWVGLYGDEDCTERLQVLKGTSRFHDFTGVQSIRVEEKEEGGRGEGGEINYGVVWLSILLFVLVPLLLGAVFYLWKRRRSTNLTFARFGNTKEDKVELGEPTTK